VDELKPRADDIVIWKNRYSGFYETGLDDILKRLKARCLVVTGCTTSVCVESTIRDAMFRDYLPVLLEDCTTEPIGRAVPIGNQEASLRVIETLFGWVSNSDHFIKALDARQVVVGRS
jgi:ureidoacrylate peracid hydrolase